MSLGVFVIKLHLGAREPSRFWNVHPRAYKPTPTRALGDSIGIRVSLSSCAPDWHVQDGHYVGSRSYCISPFRMSPFWNNSFHRFVLGFCVRVDLHRRVPILKKKVGKPVPCGVLLVNPTFCLAQHFAFCYRLREKCGPCLQRVYNLDVNSRLIYMKSSQTTK